MLILHLAKNNPMKVFERKELIICDQINSMRIVIYSHHHIPQRVPFYGSMRE